MEAALMNIPRIYTIIAEIMSCWVFFFLLKRKISAKKTILLTVLIIVAEIIYVKISEGMPMFFWPFHIVIIFLFMFIYMYFTIELSKITICYYTMKAFVIAEFVASLEWQLAYYFKWTAYFTELGQALIMLVIYFICYAMIWLIEKKLNGDHVFREVSIQEVFIAAFIVITVFLLSNISFFKGNTLFSGSNLFDMFNIRTIFDLTGVVILYAFQSRIAEVETKADLAEMNRLVQNQYDKYRNYQNSIDLINMKYHDLTHQIQNLREQISNEQKSLLIDNIETELKEYSLFFETGNQVLNAMKALMQKLFSILLDMGCHTRNLNRQSRTLKMTEKRFR